MLIQNPRGGGIVSDSIPTYLESTGEVGLHKTFQVLLPLRQIIPGKDFSNASSLDGAYLTYQMQHHRQKF